MEAHSERLKWSLAEESNQLTLTLTWNFDSAKPRKTKVTVKVTHSYDNVTTTGRVAVVQLSAESYLTLK